VRGTRRGRDSARAGLGAGGTRRGRDATRAGRDAGGTRRAAGLGAVRGSGALRGDYG